MKIIKTIIGGTITSFLFVILTILIIVQFVFTVVNMNEHSVIDLVSKDHIIENLVRNTFLDDEELTNDIDAYIDEHINYIFNKRSYPAIPLKYVGTSSEIYFREIESRLNLDNSTIDLVRNIFSIVKNRSVYLIINIAIFALVLMISISENSFLTGIKLLGYSIMISCIFILLLSAIIPSFATNIEDEILKIVVSDIIDKIYINCYRDILIVYLALGFSCAIITITIQKFVKK